jgi:hypothetical protein
MIATPQIIKGFPFLEIATINAHCWLVTNQLLAPPHPTVVIHTVISHPSRAADDVVKLRMTSSTS